MLAYLEHGQKVCIDLHQLHHCFACMLVGLSNHLQVALLAIIHCTRLAKFDEPM